MSAISGAQNQMDQMKRQWVGLLVGLSLSACAAAQAKTNPAFRVNSEKSKIEISVYREGLFKAFGHDHLIAAKEVSGRALLDEAMPERSSAALTVLTNSLTVIDPGESDKDRADVQATMLGEEVLDVKKFPEIQFKSTGVTQVKKTADGWDIVLAGVLNLHGVEKPIELPLRVSASKGQLSVRGEVSVLQTDYGITPIKVGGGTVKVKNKVRIRFDLVAEN